MTYEERARIKKRKANFNVAASLTNMVSYATSKNDAEELQKLHEKLDKSEPDIKIIFDKIVSIADNANAQDELTSKFQNTAESVLNESIAPSQAGPYQSNNAFFDDALLITFLVDSGKDLGHLKEVEKNARALSRLGTGETDLIIVDDRGWELEPERKQEPVFN